MLIVQNLEPCQFIILHKIHRIKGQKNLHWPTVINCYNDRTKELIWTFLAAIQSNEDSTFNLQKGMIGVVVFSVCLPLKMKQPDSLKIYSNKCSCST